MRHLIRVRRRIVEKKGIRDKERGVEGDKEGQIDRESSKVRG